jgi:2-oxoglutarate dehydrogenase E1 component
MGAWDFVRHRFESLAADRYPVRYVGRPPSSSPAEGSAARHAAMQAAIVGHALTGTLQRTLEHVGS